MLPFYWQKYRDIYSTITIELLLKRCACAVIVKIETRAIRTILMPIAYVGQFNN